MSGKVDRILVEVSPGEVRAVAFSGDVAWDIAQERPFAGAAPGDIYWARASSAVDGGGRFFDMGGGVSGLARRVRPGWTDGAYGLVQVLRPGAGGKGPRVTDRVWAREGVVEVSLHAAGSTEDRIEIARRAPKPVRERARAAIAAVLPEGGAVRLSHIPPGDPSTAVEAGFRKLRAFGAGSTTPRRVHAAAGEVGWLVGRWPEAAWAPADHGSAAWLSNLPVRPDEILRPDAGVAAEIDVATAEALVPQVDLPGGARLWIEPTHALVAIDVDRGRSTDAGAEINRAAGREIARQLRLRRLGGIVAIDFLREGLPEGLAALKAFSDDDLWPWSAPRGVDPSGLVSFQRARLGASLAEISTGLDACALAGLRAAVRAADRGGAPTRMRAPTQVITLLQTDLRPALQAAELRLGRSLDLERAKGLGSLEIIGPNAEILDAI